MISSLVIPASCGWHDSRFQPFAVFLQTQNVGLGAPIAHTGSSVDLQRFQSFMIQADSTSKATVTRQEQKTLCRMV